MLDRRAAKTGFCDTSCPTQFNILIVGWHAERSRVTFRLSHETAVFIVQLEFRTGTSSLEDKHLWSYVGEFTACQARDPGSIPSQRVPTTLVDSFLPECLCAMHVAPLSQHSRQWFITNHVHPVCLHFPYNVIYVWLLFSL